MKFLYYLLNVPRSKPKSMLPRLKMIFFAKDTLVDLPTFITNTVVLRKLQRKFGLHSKENRIPRKLVQRNILPTAT